MTMFSEDDALAVKRGAYWLDEEHPGWAEEINFDTFAMDNCQECIIGQAVGTYFQTIEKASGGYSEDDHYHSDDWAIDHGFNIPWGDFSFEQEQEYYSHLEVLWTEQVRDRL